ncbi:hypothetical protein [Dactylosporangium sp. CA-139066]|uniref:hypothetical protein n=1 Tax=Dactylosporangium sp. CA-139066 TaxID=3239930 RepID=UPI003D902139
MGSAVGKTDDSLCRIGARESNLVDVELALQLPEYRTPDSAGASPSRVPPASSSTGGASPETLRENSAQQQRGTECHDDFLRA